MCEGVGVGFTDGLRRRFKMQACRRVELLKVVPPFVLRVSSAFSGVTFRGMAVLRCLARQL